MEIPSIDSALKTLGVNTDLQQRLPALVKAKVESIASNTRDYEVAHLNEDYLYESLLILAANGFDIKDSAIEALKTKQLDFPRHCA